MENTNQILTIFDREKIEVNSVQEILSSTDKEIYVKLNQEILQITGENLKINKLVPDGQMLSVIGKINGAIYLSKVGKKSLFGKVFK